MSGKSPIQEIRESMSRLHQQLNPPREIRSGKSVMTQLLHNARLAEMQGRDDRWELVAATRKAKGDALHMPCAGTIFGIPVHIIPDDLARVTRPARVHRPRLPHCPTHKPRFKRALNWHLRIQKKWNKRYGFITENRVYFMDKPRFDFAAVALFGTSRQGEPPRERVMVMGEGHYATIIEEAKRTGLL